MQLFSGLLLHIYWPIFVVYFVSKRMHMVLEEKQIPWVMRTEFESTIIFSLKLCCLLNQPCDLQWGRGKDPVGSMVTDPMVKAIGLSDSLAHVTNSVRNYWHVLMA